MTEQLQSKQIQITDIKPQFIQSLNKTKYIITANDGIKYECWDQNWTMSNHVGKFVNIQFYIKQNSSNGKIYTNYIIYVPKNNLTNGITKPIEIISGLQIPQSNPDKISMIMERLNVLENNIISAIRLHCGDNIRILEDEVPNVGETTKTVDIPIINETYTGKKNPF